MYKPKPFDDAQLDKFLADLNDDEFKRYLVAQAEYDRMSKVPVPRLHLLQAIAGACMLLGSLLFVAFWLYPIYKAVVGGIR